MIADYNDKYGLTKRFLLRYDQKRLNYREKHENRFGGLNVW
jgi:hypothetical protein